MFVNFSNHPSSLWSENQRKEAEKYGEIVDLKFPYDMIYQSHFPLAQTHCGLNFNICWI